MTRRTLIRRITAPVLCAAVLTGAAACGGGGGGDHKDRDALEVQLKKGPLGDYRHFVDGDGRTLDAAKAQQRVDCYADVLLKYGDKEQVAAYAESGKDYALIGIGEPEKFKSRADACLGKDAARQFVPPYPAAALG